MNAKTLIPLVVALALGGIAAKLGKDMMDKRRQASGPSMKMARVVVASLDVAPGALIKETDVTLGNVPADSIPQYTFASTGEVIGRVASTQLVKGQTVLETLLAPKGSPSGVQVMIPEGMRAVTLEVNEFSGVAGLLTPGCRVDVLQTLRVKEAEDDSGGMVSKTIVEDLKVIAVGRRLSSVSGPDPEQIARSITVLATQEQAEVLNLATNMGQPRLVLRNGRDGVKTGGKGVTVAELRGVKKDSGEDSAAIVALMEKMFANTPATRPSTPVARTEEPRPVEKNFRDVEIIRGGTTSSVKVSLPASAATSAPSPVTGSGDKLDAAVPNVQ